jgi:small GTP-binding protein
MKLTFFSFNRNCIYKDKTMTLGLWDTAGQEEYNALRPLSYPDTQAFLATFSIVLPSSFKNIKTKWLPEIRQHCPEAPVILVGTKLDMRTDPKEVEKLLEPPLKYEQGVELADQLGFVGYKECSAKTREGLAEVFDAVIEAVMAKEKVDREKEAQKVPEKKCFIL